MVSLAALPAEALSLIVFKSFIASCFQLHVLLKPVVSAKSFISKSLADWSQVFTQLVLLSFVRSAAVTNLLVDVLSSTKSASNLLVDVISVCNQLTKSATLNLIVLHHSNVNTTSFVALS